MSIRNDILNGIAAAIGALGLTYGGNPIPVTVLLDETARPQIDAVPLFIVAPGPEKTERRRASSEGAWIVPYSVVVALINNGNLDLVTGLGDYGTVREALGKTLENPQVLVPYGVVSIMGVKVSDDALVSPTLFPQGVRSIVCGVIAALVGNASYLREERFMPAEELPAILSVPEPVKEVQLPPRKVRVGDMVYVVPSMLWPGNWRVETGPLVALVTSVCPDGSPRTFIVFPAMTPFAGVNALMTPYDPTGKQPGSWHFREDIQG